MTTKGVGGTRAKDCCAQIALVRAVALTVPDRPNPVCRGVEKQSLPTAATDEDALRFGASQRLAARADEPLSVGMHHRFHPP